MPPPDIHTEPGGEPEEIREIPTPPAGMFLIIKSAGDADVSLQELGQQIAREPSFTVQLLRVANSVRYRP